MIRGAFCRRRQQKIENVTAVKPPPESPVPTAPPLATDMDVQQRAVDTLLEAFNVVNYELPPDLLFGLDKAYFSDSQRSSQTWHYVDRCYQQQLRHSHNLCFYCKNRLKSVVKRMILKTVEDYVANLIKHLTASPQPAA